MLTRVISFAFAIATARFAPPEAYGVSYVSLQLLCSLALFPRGQRPQPTTSSHH